MKFVGSSSSRKNKTETLEKLFRYLSRKTNDVSDKSIVSFSGFKKQL